VHTKEEGGLYGLCSPWAVKRRLSRKEMQELASTPEEDFNDTLQCTQYQLDDEMEEEDVQDTQTGQQLILVGTSGQPEMTNFSLSTPQVASLDVTAGRSSLPEIKRRNVVLPAFLEEIDTKAPNTIMEQALVLFDSSLPPDGQTTGVGRLHLVFGITKLSTRTALELRVCGTVMVKQDARQPFPFASRTRVYRTEKLTTVPPDTWVELHDDDIIQMGSSQTFKYNVMIPLSPIRIPEIVPASKPHLLKLAFPGSCITRIIGQRGRVINHIK